MVVGAGGYVSGPVLLTAVLMRIRTLVMESNALPGFTNRRLALFVDAAAVSFEESLKFFHGKGVVIGNPVRREFFEIPRKQRDPARFSLLVFGGSQGARAINDALLAALPRLERQRGVLRIVHQTGEADFERVRAGYDATGWGERADVRKYIDDMVASFAESDLVVCRAGATTTAELIKLNFGGWVVDTPGIRQFQLWDIRPEEIEGFFPEFRPFVPLCAFPDCTHTHEERCAVKDAVARRQVSERRYYSYLGMFEGRTEEVREE